MKINYSLRKIRTIDKHLKWWQKKETQYKLTVSLDKMENLTRRQQLPEFIQEK